MTRAIPTDRNYLGTPVTAPGPTGQRMLRDMGRIRRNPLDYLDRTWRDYGDVVQFPVPRPASYLVNDPVAVRSVLVSNARAYGKSTIQYRSLALVTGEGLLAADTPAWREQRPMVQPAFHRETLDAVIGHVGAVTRQMIEQWSALPAGAVIDVDASIMNAALEIVGLALFGADLSAHADELTAATLQALEVVVARARVPITPPSWVPSPGNRRMQAAVARLDAAVEAMIDERGVTQRHHDMLDMLIHTPDEDGRTLTARQVRDQIITFIVAGHETVASAMTWALALLAERPAQWRILQAEADAVLTGEASLTTLGSLTAARAALDETMRLYPPAWLITRNALEGAELGGYEVPSGSLVILSPWLLHRHPAIWDAPNVFRPQRFREGTIDRGAFIPFGAGPRQCIGRDFAYSEAVLMLAMLAREFEIEYPTGEGRPAAVPLVTMRPTGGLSLRIRPRG